ncbi:hypothetical protein B0H11DRAFT_1910220 [Mycena galericulata]|nr:hypothetical protein B0H11DRAFT_1910220 [Mycena galericulata]
MKTGRVFDQRPRPAPRQPVFTSLTEGANRELVPRRPAFACVYELGGGANRALVPRMRCSQRSSGPQVSRFERRLRPSPDDIGSVTDSWSQWSMGPSVWRTLWVFEGYQLGATTDTCTTLRAILILKVEQATTDKYGILQGLRTMPAMRAGASPVSGHTRAGKGKHSVELALKLRLAYQLTLTGAKVDAVFLVARVLRNVSLLALRGRPSSAQLKSHRSILGVLPRKLFDLRNIYWDSLEDDESESGGEPVKMTEGAEDDNGCEWVSCRAAGREESFGDATNMPPHVRYGR